MQTIDENDYETIAEIFNRVNTGGRRLSKGQPGPRLNGCPMEGGRDVIEDFEKELKDIQWGSEPRGSSSDHE